jgi:hypothetical protein
MYKQIWNTPENIIGSSFNSDDVSLGFLIFCIHQYKISTSLFAKTGLHTSTIHISKGRVVGGNNIPKICQSLSIETLPGEDVGMLVGRAMSKGHSPDVVFDSISKGVGRYFMAANHIKASEFTFNEYIPPEVSIPLQDNILSLFLKGVKSSLNDEQLQIKLNGLLRVKLNILPIELNRVRLPPQLIGVLRESENGVRLVTLLKSAEFNPRWQYVNQLLEIGLLSIPTTSGNERLRETPRETREEKNKKKELSKMLDHFGEDANLIPAYQILGLEVPGSVNQAVIAENYRVLSAKYHPDRFVVLGEKAKIRAQAIFSRIAEAHQELQNEDLWPELKLRIDAESKGEKYVTDTDKKDAQLLHAQANHAFRRKSYDDALLYSAQGLEFDPYNWRLIFINIQAKVSLGQLDKQEAAEDLIKLEGPRAHERINVLFIAAEYFIHAGDQEQAFSLFHTIVEKDSEHIGARRYLRLQSMRKVAELDKAQESKGFWKGILTGRNKKE